MTYVLYSDILCAPNSRRVFRAVLPTAFIALGEDYSRPQLFQPRLNLRI